jgi:hypothetical protein
MGEEVAHVIRLGGVRGSTVFLRVPISSEPAPNISIWSPSRAPVSSVVTAHADGRVDVAGLDALARLEPRIERLNDLCGLCPGIAQKRKLIAPAQDMHGQQMLDLGEVAVELSAQLDQQTIVGKFEQQFDGQIGAARMMSRRRFAAEW